MRIAITGATGFLGSRILRLLVDQGHEVLSVGRTAPGGPIEHVSFDLSHDLAPLRAPEVLIHAAAFIPEDQLGSDSLECERLNGAGTLRLLAALGTTPPRTFINLSSSKIWRHEGQVTNPYEASKASAELFVNAFAVRSNFRALHLRLPYLYGPGMQHGRMFETFFARAMADEPIELWNEGSDSLDLLYVDDAAEVVVSTLGEAPEGVWVLGTGKTVTTREVAETIIQITGSHSELRFLAATSSNAHAAFKAEAGVRHRSAGSVTSLRVGLQRMLTVEQAKR